MQQHDEAPIEGRALSEAERLVALRTAELQATLDRLEQIINTDSLTGVASRHALESALREAYDERPPGGYISFVMVDLNGLKRINDTEGHAGGDAALRTLATILRECATEPSTLVGRLSGDEFGLLAIGLESPRVYAMAQAICERAWGSLPFGASVGMACAVQLGGEAETPERLLHHADAAQYEAKRSRATSTVTASRLIGAGMTPGASRTYRDLAYRVEVLLADCARGLDELQTGDPLQRLNCVVQGLLEPTTLTSWALSSLAPGADHFETVAYKHSRLGQEHRDRFASFYSDEEPYPVASYPSSLMAANGHAVIVRADDPAADPVEKGVLEAAGFAVMLMAGGYDGSGCRWLVEAFSEDPTFPADLMATPLRAAVAMALTGASPRR